MENIELNTNQVDLLTEIHSKIPGILIGGSLALVCHGLLDRKVHDLDFLIKDENSFNNFCSIKDLESLVELDDAYGNSSNQEVIEGESITRLNFIYKKTLTVDLFCSIDSINQDYIPLEVDIYGMKFKLADPRLIIRAKQIYFERQVNKHSNDLMNISLNLLKQQKT